MKFLPLVVAALCRKPLRGLLTLLSITVAFLMFGLMIGTDASFQRIVDLAHRDQVIVYARFDPFLPASLESQLRHVPNVAGIGKESYVAGYYQSPKNTVFVLMLDTAKPNLWTEELTTVARARRLQQTRNGIYVTRAAAAKFHLKPGDNFTLAGGLSRVDGSTNWTFQILDVIEDMPGGNPNGAMFGNYDFYDKAVPLALQGRVATFILLVKDADRASETAAAIDRMFANSPTVTYSAPESVLYASNSQAALNVADVTRKVAGIGLFMILLLTANGIAQSVRERIPEFAILKTLGFSDAGVMALVFAEAALPCLLGAVLGTGLARLLAAQIPKIIPPTYNIPAPTVSLTVAGWALAAAALLAFASAILPALRLKRLDVATALAGRA